MSKENVWLYKIEKNKWLTTLRLGCDSFGKIEIYCNVSRLKMGLMFKIDNRFISIGFSFFIKIDNRLTCIVRCWWPCFGVLLRSFHLIQSWNLWFRVWKQQIWSFFVLSAWYWDFLLSIVLCCCHCLISCAR
jgi:hypothetical protein